MLGELQATAEGQMWYMSTDASSALQTTRHCTMGKLQGICIQEGGNIPETTVKELNQNLMQGHSTGLRTVCPRRWQKGSASGDVKENY